MPKINYKKFDYIFRRNTTYYTRVKIPPDLQSRFGLTEFRFSLYTFHLSQAKHLSRAINKFIQEIYNNIMKRGKMSTLSKDQLQTIIKEYVKDFIHSFELGKATNSKQLNPYSHIDLLNGHDWVLSEEHDTLAAQIIGKQCDYYSPPIYGFPFFFRSIRR